MAIQGTHSLTLIIFWWNTPSRMPEFSIPTLVDKNVVQEGRKDGKTRRLFIWSENIDCSQNALPSDGYLTIHFVFVSSFIQLEQDVAHARKAWGAIQIVLTGCKDHVTDQTPSRQAIGVDECSFHFDHLVIDPAKFFKTRHLEVVEFLLYFSSKTIAGKKLWLKEVNRSILNYFGCVQKYL